jgi:hypothetical protein
MLTATQINAGFFDNLTNNLQNGDIGGLLTDVVSDVATELKKEQESNNKNQGTSFGSTANEEDVQEEHTENASKEPDTLHSSNIEVSASDLEICDMWYCGDKKGKT